MRHTKLAITAAAAAGLLAATGMGTAGAAGAFSGSQRDQAVRQALFDVLGG